MLTPQDREDIKDIVVDVIQDTIMPAFEVLATKTELQSGLQKVETRLQKVETRLDGVETRLDGIETRLDGVETRLDTLDRKVDRIGDGLLDIKHEQTNRRNAWKQLSGFQ